MNGLPIRDVRLRQMPMREQTRRLLALRQEPRIPAHCVIGDPHYRKNLVGDLIDLLLLIKPGVVLEIGAYYGVSTEALALLCARVVTVDPWPEQIIFDKFFARCGQYRHLSWRRGKSPQALQEFPAGAFDLCYIDGDHSAAAVRVDIAACLRVVKPGGWLAGHDFDNPAVAAAVGDLLGAPKVFADTSWLIKTSGKE